MRTKRPVDWTVGHTESPDMGPERFVPATVPGAVQLDWARAAGWGDVHFGENWRAYEWMEDVHWVYRATLPLHGLRADQRLFFVCGGLGFLLLLDRLEPDVAQGEPLPDASLIDAEGAPFEVATLKGKVVLMEFWSAT